MTTIEQRSAIQDNQIPNRFRETCNLERLWSGELPTLPLSNQMKNLLYNNNYGKKLTAADVAQIIGELRGQTTCFGGYDFRKMSMQKGIFTLLPSEEIIQTAIGITCFESDQVNHPSGWWLFGENYKRPEFMVKLFIVEEAKYQTM